MWAAIAVMIAAAMLIAGCPSTPTNKSPTASMFADKDVLFSGGSVTFNASASKDSDGKVKTFMWDFGDGASATETNKAVSHAFTKAGVFSVKLVVKDDKGAKSKEINTTVVVAPIPTAVPTTVNTLENVTFQIDNSSLGGRIVDFAWNFGDNSAVVKGSSVTHFFKDNGTYNISLTLSTAGGKSASQSLQVTVQNQAPTANISVSTVAPFYTNKPVAFSSAQSGDVDGTIVKWAWDFGDNSTDTTASPSHKYTVPGTYTVKLTVTDNDNASASATYGITLVKDLVLKNTTVVVYKDDNNISRANVTITFDNMGDAKAANTINVTVTAFKQDKSPISSGDFKKSKTVGAPVDSGTQGAVTTITELLIDNGSPDKTWYFIEIAYNGNIVDSLWYQKA